MEWSNTWLFTLPCAFAAGSASKWLLSRTVKAAPSSDNRRAPPRARVLPDTSSQPCSWIWAVWRRQVTLRYQTCAVNFMFGQNVRAGVIGETDARPRFCFIYDLWRTAVVYTAVRVTRGSVLLLLIINWRLNFRLMVAGFVAEGGVNITNSVWLRAAWLRCVPRE